MRVFGHLFPAIFSLLVFGCDGMSPTLGDGNASNPGGAGTSASAPPCQGFRDITGVCLSVVCLEGNFCDSKAAMPCDPGFNGDGVCFSGQCIYRNAVQGCGSAADCPCGFCGSDGRCYEDRSGQCGSCGRSAPKEGDGACKACLASCQGTGPLCCAGEGCLCEGQCGGFM